MSYIYFIAGINIMIILFLIFFERRDPNSTLTWILILSLLPLVGFVLYLVIGQNLKKRKTFSSKMKNDRALRRVRSKDSYDDDGENSMKYDELIRLNYNSEGAAYRTGNSVQLIFDGEEKFEELFREIRAAEEYIHMQYYIIENDGQGLKMLEELTKKVQEGVEVKLLVDTIGSFALLRKNKIRAFLEAGGEYSVFFPNKIPYLNKRLNYINHRKIVVVDGRIGFLGGFNVGDAYIGKDKKVGYWRDTHIKVNGLAINDLEHRFLLDWTYSKQEDMKDYSSYLREKPESEGDVAMQIISSGPDLEEPYIRNGFIKMINLAEKSVFIQTPYFVPDEPMKEAIKMASLSGIDVRIMIPKYTDHLFMKWAINSYVENLMDCGVKFYLYHKGKSGFLHAKTIVIDEEICSIGTANMDMRSFKLNFECNAFIYDKNIAQIQNAQFLEDMRSCEEVSLDKFNRRGISNKAMESVVRLFSPLL